jgi:hypothetical protein
MKSAIGAAFMLWHTPCLYPARPAVEIKEKGKRQQTAGDTDATND